MLECVRLAPASGGEARSLVVLIHGYGANGDDLIDLGRAWVHLLPDTAFIAPHAPEACAIAPQQGRQWFPLTHNPGGLRSPDEYWNGVCHAEKDLHAFLDVELAQYDMDESQCALVGFSQGTMMALHVGLRRAVQLAGIVGYSGVLCGADRLAQDIVTKPPVYLTHGDMDGVIPVEALPLALDGLHKAGVTVSSDIVAGLGHGIEASGLTKGGAFLKQVLV